MKKKRFPWEKVGRNAFFPGIRKGKSGRGKGKAYNFPRRETQIMGEGKKKQNGGPGKKYNHPGKRGRTFGEKEKVDSGRERIVDTGKKRGQR